MEALQTDVMRFMAILGLCLAAIFSLVKSPDFNPPAPVQSVVTEDVTVEQPSRRAEASVEAPIPDPAPRAHAEEEPTVDSNLSQEQQGFSLEFASASSLGILLDGGGVTLLVTDGREYWTWTGRQGFVATAGPPRYYQMQPHTVPVEYRRALEASLEIQGRTWGVVLTEAITGQITTLMHQNTGGVLVISAQGVVRLDKKPG